MGLVCYENDESPSARSPWRGDYPQEAVDYVFRMVKGVNGLFFTALCSGKKDLDWILTLAVWSGCSQTGLDNLPHQGRSLHLSWKAGILLQETLMLLLLHLVGRDKECFKTMITYLDL